MSISTYAELKTAVDAWLHRGDLASMIADFVTLGEAYLNRVINTPEMEENATVTTSTSDRFASLPSGCKQVKSLADSDGELMRPALAGYVQADSVGATSGKPRFYAVTDRFEFDRVSDQVYSLSCIYTKKLDIETDTTNWLLTDHPDCYLYAALMQATPYIKNDSRVSLIKGLLDDAIHAVNSRPKTRPALRVDAALVSDGVFDIVSGE